MRLPLVAIAVFTLLLPVGAGAQVDPDTLSIPGLVEAARTAAREDRNAESARLLALALERAPELRGELLAEYADQLTYSDRAGEAVPLYREILDGDPAPDPGAGRRLRSMLALALSWSGDLRASLREYEALLADDPGNREAGVGRARVLSWLGRLGPAGSEYRRVLRAHPGDLEARRDVARVEVWRGRHREGVSLLEGFLADHPEDREARLLLAQTWYWMGRPDRAAPVVAGLDAETPAGSEFRGRLDSFRKELQRAGAPVSRAAARRSTQSNDLTIQGLRAEHTIRFEHGLGETGVHYQGLRYDPVRDVGEPARTLWEHRFGVAGRYRPSDRVQLTGSVEADLIRPPASGTPHDLLLFSAYATLSPNDDVRLYLGARRETMDNERSLLAAVVATFVSASLDWVPDEKSRMTVRTDLGSFSDGNGRRWVEVEAARRILEGPHVILGVRGAWFEFDELADNGYFNPLRYRGAVAWSHGWGQVGQYTWWDYDVSYGLERLDPGDDKPIWSAEASLTRTFAGDVAAKVGYRYFSSRHFSSSGFERGTLVLSLEYGW